VINCHLSSISHCFWDIKSRSRSKTTPPQFDPRSRGPHSNLLHFCENCMILTSPILSQYTRITDDRQRLMPVAEVAIQLKCSAKNYKNWPRNVRVIVENQVALFCGQRVGDKHVKRYLLFYASLRYWTVGSRESLRLMAFGEQKDKTRKKFRCHCRKKKKKSYLAQEEGKTFIYVSQVERIQNCWWDE